MPLAEEAGEAGEARLVGVAQGWVMVLSCLWVTRGPLVPVLPAHSHSWRGLGACGVTRGGVVFTRYSSGTPSSGSNVT